MNVTKNIKNENNHIPSSITNKRKFDMPIKSSVEHLVSQNERLSRDIAFQNLCLSIFQSFINPDIDIAVISKEVISKIVSVLELEGGIIYQTTEKQMLQAISSSNISKEFLEENETITIGKGKLGKLIKEKKISISNDMNIRECVKNYDKAAGKGYIISVPIKNREEILSAAILFTTDTKYYSDEYYQMFNVISDYLSMGFKNYAMYNEAKKLATKDVLTDLHNRLYFQEFLSLELNRSKRYKKPLSLAIMDIDFFKNINDNYGHQTGDLILKEFAKMLKESFRKTDLVARYGGEEFIAVFPEADTDNAMKVMSKLQKKLNNHIFENNGEKHKITVSMGISAFDPEKKISPEELIERADKALYDAKESGRNTVKVWDTLKHIV